MVENQSIIIEELKNTITNLEIIRDTFAHKIDQLKSENEKLKTKSKELYEFNQELINRKSKILTEQIEAESKLELIEDYCKGKNLETDCTACWVLHIIREVNNDICS